jgi:undecaprenyl-diphosphatase
MRLAKVTRVDDWGRAVVLGVVQGLTEFLPVSSSAHLRVVSDLAGWEDPGAAFTAVTQLGTEAAVLLYFRQTIWAILSTWSRSLWTPSLRGELNARMGWYVIVGTLPIAVLGLLLEDLIEQPFRDLRLVAAMLGGFALVLALADRVGRRTKDLDELTLRDSVLFGLAQALALIPGVSRSGGTLSAGLLLGYSRVAAARYSFLLAIPAVLASGLYKLTDIGGDGAPAWGPTVVATLVSFGVGYVVIVGFLRYLASGTFVPFVAYRLALAVLLVVLIAVGVLDPVSSVVRA